MIGLDRRNRRVDCLSDEDGVVYTDQEVQQSLRLKPPQPPCRGWGSTHTANSILQGQAVPGQALLCMQSYIRVTAAGRPVTRPAGPQANPRVSVTETVSTYPLQEFIQTNAVKCLELQC